MENGSLQQIFKVGDVVSPVRDLTFEDGSQHLQGHEYYVREGEEVYYAICQKEYFKVR